MTTHREPWPSAADPLGEALHFLELRGAFYCRSEFTAPFGLELPPFEGYLWFHVITAEAAGSRRRKPCRGAWPQASWRSSRTARATGCAVSPTCRRRASSSSSASSSASATRFCATGAVAKASTWSAVPCASTIRSQRKLLAVLPRILTLDPATSPTQLEWLRSTLRLMALEAEGLRPGGETVITRLSDVLVVQALRAWLESDPAAKSGWLGALRDPQIGRAISFIHREPGRLWTVASLADQIPMSRSAFAARFTELVGEPAMSYVTRWRMHLAAAALRGEGATVATLAERFGYRSEAAFARAFKRVIGTPPGAVRRAGPVESIAA